MKITEIISRKARKTLRQNRRGHTKTSDPYYMGDEARHAGKSEDENPYPVGSEDHADWKKGWQEAMFTEDAEVSVSPTRTREFRATPDLMALAVADTNASEHRHDMEVDAHGVIVGALRRLDHRVHHGRITLDDVSKDWKKTLDFIKAKYGDKVILYRADAPKREHNANTQTVYFASKKMADRYAYTGRTIKPYLVPTDDIVAVHAKPNGYYEVIVKLPKGGLVPMDPASLKPVEPTTAKSDVNTK